MQTISPVAIYGQELAWALWRTYPIILQLQTRGRQFDLMIYGGLKADCNFWDIIKHSSSTYRKRHEPRQTTLTTLFVHYHETCTDWRQPTLRLTPEWNRLNSVQAWVRSDAKMLGGIHRMPMQPITCRNDFNKLYMKLQNTNHLKLENKRMLSMLFKNFILPIAKILASWNPQIRLNCLCSMPLINGWN
jgi:hypothetical protein